jgi:hypothetical protein
MIVRPRSLRRSSTRMLSSHEALPRSNGTKLNQVLFGLAENDRETVVALLRRALQPES